MDVMRLASILTVLVLGAGAPAFVARGEPANWRSLRRWEQPQGLPQNTVFSFLQTRDGYLWAGTRGGLARFNGMGFTTFDNRDRSKLPDNEIWGLAEDDDGGVWIGTYGGGLSRLLHGRFTVWTVKDGLVDNFITACAKDGDGGMWIGTDHGVSLYKGGKFTNYTMREGLPSNVVRALCVDADGSVWVGAEHGGVSLIKNGHVTAHPIEDLGTPDVTSIHRDQTKTLWIATTTEGLISVNEAGIRHYTEVDGLPSNWITCVSEDDSGGLWVGTTEGLAQRDGDHFEMTSLGMENGRDYIRTITTDREGSLWVGTADRGFVCLRHCLFRSIATGEGKADEYIYSICEDGYGGILVGTARGLNRVKDGRVRHYSAEEGLTSRMVLSMARGNDGTVWVGTNTGLFHSRDRSDAATTDDHREFIAVDDPAIRKMSVRMLFVDHEGAVWLGTNLDGLARYKDGAVTLFTTRDGLAENAIRGLCESRDGSLWIGTRGGGINRYKDGKFTHYTEKDGLVGDIVQVLYLDHDDTLWIGTRQGLSRFKDGKFVNYTVNEGLYINYVSGIAEDDRGNFWMNSASGVFRVSKQDMNDFAAGKIKTVKCYAYGLEHGLSSTVGTAGGSPATYAASDGRVWFATFYGVNVVDPGDLVTNTLAPPVHIETVAINEKSFDVDQVIEAKPGRGDLAFRYAGLSFIAPEKVRFKYQLEGYDLDWVDAGNRREAFYSNIPPGHYTFRVLAANSDGVWNTTGATLAFYLRPHFYQAMWFRVLLALAGAGLIGWAIRWRMLRFQGRALELQRQNDELERRIIERTSELAKSYDALRASEYFYHSLLESLPQIIVRKDASGRYTYANSAFADMIGRPLNAIVGHTDAELLTPDDAAKSRADDIRAMNTKQVIEYEDIHEKNGGKCYLHAKKVPLYDASGRAVGLLQLYWDMSLFRETEEKLKQTQKELLEASRLAGMAEVATGVLHNIGNVLNSVNTSANLAGDRIKGLRIPGVGKVAQLLTEQAGRLAEFFTSDSRALQLPGYLTKLTEHLETERAEAVRELKLLQEHIEHIKEIVALQQSHARVSAVTELVEPAELAESALQIAGASLARHGIVVRREFSPVPKLNVQRQRVLQILVNLIRNAKDAMDASPIPGRYLTLTVRLSPEGQVQIGVSDTGIGIAPENLTRIFAFGFTTKKDGHGFGLHSSALTAKEMGGSLRAVSEGVGRGSMFILELAPADEKAAKETTAVASAETF